ncbi:MAG: hypothetical protein KY459_14020 [Acidobacteria bacterium]|nr:hypothetical protein [Acidobacteriota bacterium]
MSDRGGEEDPRDFPSPDSPKRRFDRLHVRLIMLALLLLPLALIKISFTPGARNFGLDAAYYFQVAGNVASGQGLVTSVSLYHQALDPLPQASSTVYPAWPYVLGMTGRVIGVMPAALLLPKILYILDLVLLYFLAAAISRSMGIVSAIQRTPIDAGHLLVALFATNQTFFFATSHPYTEGLAFAFAFGALLAFDRASRSGGLAWSLAAGLLAGLAFLTRTQMILLAGGLGLAASWGVIVQRRPTKLLIGTVAPVLVILTGWYFFVYTAPTQRADVPGFRMWVATESWWDWVVERLIGLAVSLDPFSTLSYVYLFGPAAYLPVLALVSLLIVAARKRFRPRPPAPSVAVATILAGIAFFGVLNLFHQQFFLPWLFGWRHGLPYIFLLLPSTIYLLSERREGWVRWGTVLLIVWSVALGLGALANQISRPQRFTPAPAEIEMMRWLDRNHGERPTLLTTHAQNLSVFMDANFHWMTCDDPPERTRMMIEHLPIDYVIVYGFEERCPYQAKSQLADVLEPVGAFGNGEIFLLRPVR